MAWWRCWWRRLPRAETHERSNLTASYSIPCLAPDPESCSRAGVGCTPMLVAVPRLSAGLTKGSCFCERAGETTSGRVLPYYGNSFHGTYTCTIGTRVYQYSLASNTSHMVLNTLPW